MIFVVVGSSRDKLNELTKLLLSAFPGSTIYQHIDPKCVSKDVLNNKVNGVFFEAEACTWNVLELIRLLRNHKQDLSVYLLSENEDLRITAAEAGADGYFVYPLTVETIKQALLNK